MTNLKWLPKSYREHPVKPKSLLNGALALMKETQGHWIFGIEDMEERHRNLGLLSAAMSILKQIDGVSILDMQSGNIPTDLPQKED